MWAAKEVFSTDALSLLLHPPLTVHGARRGTLSFSQHAGLGNRSASDRVFLYAAIHSGRDEN